MPLKNEINQLVQEIISSGNTDTLPTYAVPKFEIEDIYPILKHCFNANAQKVMANKTHDLIYQYNEYMGPKGFEGFHGLLDLMHKLGVGLKFDNSAIGWRRNFDKVNFFGSRCEHKDLQRAIDKVVSSINHLADLGFMKASLMNLGVLKFMPANGGPQEYAVISYVTLTIAGETYVAANMPKMTMQEGEVPSKVDEQ